MVMKILWLSSFQKIIGRKMRASGLASPIRGWTACPNPRVAMSAMRGELGVNFCANNFLDRIPTSSLICAFRAICGLIYFYPWFHVQSKSFFSKREYATMLEFARLPMNGSFSGLSILLVEDEVLFRKQTASSLEQRS